MFTQDEINSVKDALEDVSDVGIRIKSRQAGDQEKAFFDKAKLWRVIKQVIMALYIQKLVSGDLLLIDTDGNEYKVVPND